MRPHTIRLNIKRLVVDHSALRGQAMNEAMLAASLDQALRSRFEGNGLVPRGARSHDIVSQLVEAMWRETLLSRYFGVSEPPSSSAAHAPSRRLSTEATRDGS